MALHPDIERLALLGWRMAPQTVMTRKGYRPGYRADATHDLDTLERWTSEYRGCNWCVATGAPSGIWVLDVDVPGESHKDDGVASLKELIEQNSPIPPRPMLRSGGGGYGMVFAWTSTSPAKSRTSWPAKGLDLKAANVVTTLPPSIHRYTRKHYKWLTPPWELTPPVAPDWLLKLCAPPAQAPLPERPFFPTVDIAMRSLDRACQMVINAASGTRNATLNKAAYTVGRWLGAGLIHEREAASALYAAARHAGLDDGEVRDTLRSGLAAGAQRPMEARA